MSYLVTPSEVENRVVEVWRANGRLDSTIRVYLSWARRFEQHHGGRAAAIEGLTRAGVETFASNYARQRGIHVAGAVCRARVALRAWSRGLRRCGEVVPEWAPSPVVAQPFPLLAELRGFRLQHAGVATSTVARDLALLSEFLDIVVPGHAGTERLDLTLHEIDDYVTAASSRWSRKSIARFCTSLRSFLRFLHHKGYLEHDLAASVSAPVVRFGEQPPRALPWSDVQRLLGVIDVSRRTGRRDCALLLLMALYGMGAAEALHLRLEDFDWRAGSIKVFRPKTDVEYLLPLLPAVAQALLAYLRHGRPANTTTRRVFVAAVEPHGPMSSSAVRHARRQIELGAPLKTVGDILGHRSPSSTSAYVRIATTQLRSVALPVPQP